MKQLIAPMAPRSRLFTLLIAAVLKTCLPCFRLFALGSEIPSKPLVNSPDGLLDAKD